MDLAGAPEDSGFDAAFLQFSAQNDGASFRPPHDHGRQVGPADPSKLNLDLFADDASVCTGAPTVGATDIADVGDDEDFKDVMWMMMDWDQGPQALPSRSSPAHPPRRVDATRTLSPFVPPFDTGSPRPSKRQRVTYQQSSLSPAELSLAGSLRSPVAQHRPTTQIDMTPPQLDEHGRITEQTDTLNGVDDTAVMALLNQRSDACEQLLIDIGCLMERKRQRAERCRVVDCQGHNAERSPFLCKFHNHVGTIFVVLADPARLSTYGIGAKLPRVKLCNRCHRWEWLPNFTNRAGKYNLTCKMCCGKANYRSRTPGRKLTSIAVSFNGLKKATIKIDSETTLAECRESLLPDVNIGNRGPPYAFARPNGSRVDADDEATVKAKNICIKKTGRNRLTLALVEDRSAMAADGSPALRPSGSSPVLHPHPEKGYIYTAGPNVNAMLSGPGHCEGTLESCSLLAGRANQPGNRCRVRGCTGSAASDPFLCPYHNSEQVFVAVMGSRAAFVRLCPVDRHFQWLAAFVTPGNGHPCSTHAPSRERTQSRDLAVGHGSESGDMEMPHDNLPEATPAGSPSALFVVAQSLLRAFTNFVASLGESVDSMEGPNPADTSSAAYHKFCSTLFDRMKAVNQRTSVRTHLDAISDCRNLWDECTGDNGVTLLHFATAVGAQAVVKQMQEYGLMQTLLHDSSTAEQEGRFDLSPKICVRAASQGNLQLVRQAIDVGVDVDCYSSDTCVYTPLMAAARSGHVRVAEYLVSRGADVSLQGQDGQTPLILAARNNHLNVVQLLLSHGADANATDMYGYTAIMRAARGGHLNVVKCLTEANADVNKAAKYNGYTALIWAAIKGYGGIAEYLVEHGADMDLRNTFGESALTWARYNRHHGIQALLTRHSMRRGQDSAMSDSKGQGSLSDVARQLQECLTQVLRDAGLETLPKALAVPSDGTAAGHDARTYHAFCEGMLNTMRTVTNDPRVNKHLSAHHGGKALWQVVKCENGLTLESLASMVGCERVERQLLDQREVQSLVDGAPLSESNESSARSIVLAASLNNTEDVVAHLEAGLPVHVRYGDYTPLMAAARLGHTRTVQVLLDRGARTEDSTKDGQTPLILAANCAHMETVTVLVKSGADVNACDMYGPVIVRACRNGHSEVVEFLVHSGANVNVVGKYNGFTALMWAAHNGNLAMTKFLVEQGADINVTNMFGETALHWAKMQNNYDVVKYLEEQKSKLECDTVVGGGSPTALSKDVSVGAHGMLLGRLAHVATQQLPLAVPGAPKMVSVRS